MSKKLAPEEKQIRKEARATAKAKAEALMADVGTFSPSDIFILDEAKYVVLSIDSLCAHVHANLLDESDEIVPDGWRQVAFGTKVTVVKKAVVETPAPEAPEVPDNPAVSGGRWFK